jgi:hypothetical protein
VHGGEFLSVVAGGVIWRTGAESASGGGGDGTDLGFGGRNRVVWVVLGSWVGLKSELG